MAGRSPARFLAPIALLAAAVALLLVVTSGGSDQPDTTSAPSSQQVRKASPTPTARKKQARRSYTIRTGDTPSGIAERNGVSLETLLELNPDLDPQSLNPGTKIKLRR